MMLNDMTYSSAVRRHLRQPDAYIEQAGNLLAGVLRLLGSWLLMTSVYTVTVVTVVFISVDLDQYSLGEMQQGVRVMVFFSGGCAAVVCLLGNLGRFRNVFTARAQEDMRLLRCVRSETASSIETTEQLLLAHGLISKEDIEQRKARGSARPK